jgi:hypothetical protein
MRFGKLKRADLRRPRAADGARASGAGSHGSSDASAFHPEAPPSRTKWTRRVPHPVLTGHASSLTPY